MFTVTERFRTIPKSFFYDKRVPKGSSHESVASPILDCSVNPKGALAYLNFFDMTEEKLRAAVAMLFDYCSPEALTHHLSQATADMARLNYFDTKVDRSNAIFHNAYLINFIHKIHEIVEEKPSIPLLDQSQLN